MNIHHLCPPKLWHVCLVWWAYLFLAYMAITCEVDVALCYVLAYTYTNVSSICTCSLLVLKAIFAMWQPYLFSEICYIYVPGGTDVNYMTHDIHLCTKVTSCVAYIGIFLKLGILW